MGQKLCCPLRPEKNEHGTLVEDFGYCVGKDCAWYIESYEGCALAMIGHAIHNLRRD